MITNNEFKQRIENIQKKLINKSDSLILITPGPNLRYLTGYKAKNLERLTCLSISSKERPVLLVPELEKLAALDSGIDQNLIEVKTWKEGSDPFDFYKKVSFQEILIDEKMTADKVLNFQKVFQDSKFFNLSSLMKSLRSIKSQYEINELKQVGKMIDDVHSYVPTILKPGLSEIEIAKKIGNKILEVGHETVDFVIVASGKNSASPHHEPTDKIVEKNDIVVVDIGGTSYSGYCSDSTRTYCVGSPEKEFADYYEILKTAQESACKSVKKDFTGKQLDDVARNILNEAGLGKFFTHRTGHGIGMETHEEPYIVSTNSEKIIPGNAFSIEPGFYIENKFGARIEDIVVKTEDGLICCNETKRELIVVQ